MTTRTWRCEPSSCEQGIVIDLIRPQHVVCIGTAAELPQAHLSRTPASSEELVWAVTRLDELAWVTSYRLFYRVHAADRWIALGHFDGNRDAATVNLAHLSKRQPPPTPSPAPLRAAAADSGPDRARRPVSGDLAYGQRSWCTKCWRTCSCALPVAEAGRRQAHLKELKEKNFILSVVTCWPVGPSRYLTWQNLSFSYYTKSRF